MKKIKLLYIVFCMGAAVALAGCGDGTDELGNSGESGFTMVEPTDLSGMVSGTMEESQGKAPEADGAAQGMGISYITGQLTEEEETAVLEAMKTLHQNLEIEDYIGEGIHLVSSEVWFESMAARLFEGCRSYTLEEDGKVLLSVQVGYDIAGNPYANICYQGEDGKLLLLKQAAGVTWLMETTVADGRYEGAFNIWQFDTVQGKIERQQGTYAQGILVGEYTKSVYDKAQGGAFELWNNRENFAYETNTMVYDEQGEIIPTPSPEPTPQPTKRPAVTSTPTPTQAPTPAPTPEPPAKEPDPQPEPEPEPQPTPAPTQAPTQGDNDAEWSEDLM